MRDKQPKIICPKCGGIAQISQTKYGLRASHCDLWSWDGKPLVDADTHSARRIAHINFDRIWKGKLMNRSAAYAAMANIMGISGKDCHIALFSKEQARMVPDIAEKIIESMTLKMEPSHE